MPLAREQQKKLVELLLSLPPAQSHAGRTTLLGDAIGLKLNRVESNARADVEGIVYQLVRLRAHDELAALIENALGYALGTGAAQGLDALLRAVQSAPAVPLEPRAKRQMLRPGDEYLCCGRSDVWDGLKGATAHFRAHALLLCGSVDAGHVHFLGRIKRFRGELEANVETVERNVFDFDDGRSPDSLGDALGVCSQNVVDAAADTLAEKNLILIYPEATTSAERAWLTRHHLHAVPRLFEQAAQRLGRRPDRALIAVQPLLWKRRCWDDKLKWLSADAATHRAVAPLGRKGLAQPQVQFEHLDRIKPEHVRNFVRRVYSGDPSQLESKLEAALKLRETCPSDSNFIGALRTLMAGG